MVFSAPRARRSRSSASPGSRRRRKSRTTRAARRRCRSIPSYASRDGSPGACATASASCSLNVKPSLQDFLEVQQHFELPSEALVEKDWYVVRALAAIASLDLQPLRLVFGGGTSLSRAHRLTRRMSEDVDLKIVGAVDPPRAALRSLRERVTGALLEAGFQFDPQDPAHRDRKS